MGSILPIDTMGYIVVFGSFPWLTFSLFIDLNLLH